MKILLLGFLILFTSATAEILQCHYTHRGPVPLYSRDGYYCCSVNNLDIFSGHQVIIGAVEGEHERGKSNNDVITLEIESAPNMVYFPKNIGNIFKNIQYIFMRSSKLKVITSEHFKEFPNLIYLILRGNEIETIHEDLFSHNPQLETIHLHNNKISHIDNKAFSGLSKLVELTLHNNVCKFTLEDSRSSPTSTIKKIEEGFCKA